MSTNFFFFFTYCPHGGVALALGLVELTLGLGMLTDCVLTFLESLSLLFILFWRLRSFRLCRLDITVVTSPLFCLMFPFVTIM